MNFYYDPILGLQYEDSGTFIVIDVTSIPEELNLGEAIRIIQKAWDERGEQLYDSTIITPINFRG